MERLFRLMALCACVFATGCASVAGGNVQKIYVQAQNKDGSEVSGADCQLSNDKGTWRLRAPGDSSVVRSNRPIEVKCDKAPLPQGVVSVESGTRAAMFGNILIGGVVGAVIDHSSGAAYEYPEQIRVVMGQLTSLPWVAGGTKAPPPSGYAALTDVSAVPYLGPHGRDVYREWNGRPNPKAFAISADGHYAWASGTSPADKSLPTDPFERAVSACDRHAQIKCKLYAVNDNVVWVKEAPALTAPVVSAAAPTAAAPAAAAPATAVVDEPKPVPVVATPSPSDQPARIASGFAAIDDVDAIPYLSDRGRQGYREWLVKGTPRAFALAPNGSWASAWGLKPLDASAPTDPAERALRNCSRNSSAPCKLYAVNNAVVWVKEAAENLRASTANKKPD